tara:strand:- start:178 stop:384 length:207 start_codon:yes stop_codon:yes gene_type:complete
VGKKVHFIGFNIFLLSDKDTNTKLMMFLLEKFIKRNDYDRLKISVNVFLQHLEINGCYMKKRNGPPAW